MRVPHASHEAGALSRRKGQVKPRRIDAVFLMLAIVFIGAIAVYVAAIRMYNLDPVPSSVEAYLRTEDITARKAANDVPTFKTIYTIFAGRRNRMLIQEPYWKEMIRIGAIDEVHLWDYCFDMDDRKHLYTLGEKYSGFVKIMRPQDVGMGNFYWFDHNHSLPKALERYGNPTEGRALLKWPPERGYTEYFQYYASTSNKHSKDIIIKGDDDIVWINTTQVRPFAAYLVNRTDVFLLSASIINQGLCAHYQQKHGAIPKSLIGDLPLPGNGMGGLHDNSTDALTLHKYFLSSEEARQKFYITDPQFYEFGFTINVNFVAMRWSDFPEYVELINEKLVEEDRYYDEGAITWDPIRKRKKLEGIYMPLVVAHATFGAQKDKTTKILSEYVAYAKKERASLYGDILDNWTP